MHIYIEFLFQYKVPHVAKTRELVAKVADDLWAKIRGMLGTDCRRCSATTDIWSSKLYNDSYIGNDFIIRNIKGKSHILSSVRSYSQFSAPQKEEDDGCENRYESLVLVIWNIFKNYDLSLRWVGAFVLFIHIFFIVAVESFNQSHTGQLIAEKLQAILERNGVSTKCRWILTDNAPNMIKVGGVCLFLTS